MKNAILYILGISLLFSACVNKEQKRVYQISDFISTQKVSQPDTSVAIDHLTYFTDSDIIPVQFGYQIFDSIITELPFETSSFRRTWSWDIDTINKVQVKRTNLRLDPKHQLSNDTYFFAITFTTVDSLPISATIYTDLKNEQIGTYIFPERYFKCVKINDDKEKIDNLRNKLKTYWH